MCLDVLHQILFLQYENIWDGKANINNNFKKEINKERLYEANSVGFMFPYQLSSTSSIKKLSLDGK